MHVVLGEDPRQAGEIMHLSWFRYLPIFPQKICRKWLERGRSREPLLGLLPPGQHVHWWLFKGDERMRLHFAAFHAFPHELHSVLWIFSAWDCIPLLVYWCVCLCLTKCPHDTQIQQRVKKDSASKCSVSPHLQLNHTSISWNSLKKNTSWNKFVCLFFKDNWKSGNKGKIT